VVRLELEHPDRQFYKPCRLCEHMKAITLESVYQTLRDEPAPCLVTVPEGVRQRAAAAMLRMIDLGPDLRYGNTSTLRGHSWPPARRYSV